MVRGRHNEFGARGNGAELADYQLLGAGCVEYVPGLEESRVVRVVVVGEVSDLDLRRGDQRLQEDRVFFLVVDHSRPVNTHRVRDRAHVYMLLDVVSDLAITLCLLRAGAHPPRSV